MCERASATAFCLPGRYSIVQHVSAIVDRCLCCPSVTEFTDSGEQWFLVGTDGHMPKMANCGVYGEKLPIIFTVVTLRGA